MSTAMEDAALLGDNYCQVRYEDLLAEPVGEVRGCWSSGGGLRMRRSPAGAWRPRASSSSLAAGPRVRKPHLLSTARG